MSDFKRDLRRYIDGLEEPVSVQETMSRGIRQQRFRIPVAVMAGAAVVLLPALVLGLLRLLPGEDSDVAATTLPPTTEAVVVDTTVTTIDATGGAEPLQVDVPDLGGLDIAQATALLDQLGLRLSVVESYPVSSGGDEIRSQAPLPGGTLDPGGTVQVGITILAECLTDAVSDPQPAAGEMAVNVVTQCSPDYLYPNMTASLTRLVPEDANVYAATLRGLLAGLTEDELDRGYVSFFEEQTRDALESATLDGSRLVVDFNDSVLIGNASTSTGGLFFLAELQANVFQFPEVESVEFRLNGSCDSFYGWLQGECEIRTRTQWEDAVRYWDSQLEAQPIPGEIVRPDDVVGKTFTASPVDGSSAIAQMIDGELFATNFSEVGGWLLDDTDTDEMLNWAIHVAGAESEMVWLVESLGLTDSGHMIYEVRATLDLPWEDLTLTADPFVMGAMNNCTLDGAYEASLVVMAMGGGREEMDEAMAWTINVPEASFEEVPVERVECFMETG